MYYIIFNYMYIIISINFLHTIYDLLLFAFFILKITPFYFILFQLKVHSTPFDKYAIVYLTQFLCLDI